MAGFFEWKDAPKARFAVIGDPIGHSRSPQMHNAALRALGQTGEYVAVRVPQPEVVLALDHLAALGYEGVNVTIPNKSAVIPWLTDLVPFASRVGAVNTIDVAHRQGTNTDGPGFLDTLVGLGVSPGSRVLILGAGGSTRAILPALVDAGYPTSVWNRTPDRAALLVSDVRVDAVVLDELDARDYRLIVNATSTSLQEDVVLPIDWTTVRGDTIAYDLAYPGSKSAFLSGAAGAGLRTCDGLELLVAQGARSLSWWLGVEAPRQAMREAIQ